MRSRCRYLSGPVNPDISGIGIIIAFASQAFIALAISLYAELLDMIYVYRHRITPDADITKELERSRPRREKQQEIIKSILLVSSDSQLAIGLALIISGLVQSRILDLYHFHIIYDLVNFTAVSNCAAIYSAFTPGPNDNPLRFWIRYQLIGIFSILYLVFTIIFATHLSRWDENVYKSCYNAEYISSPRSHHPTVDEIYVGFTCFWLFTSLFSAIAGSGSSDANFGFLTAIVRTRNLFRRFILRRTQTLVGNLVKTNTNESNAWTRIWGPIGRFYTYYLPATFIRQGVGIYAIMQFPLHLYFVIALRASNAGRLTGGNENQWEFGQIIALVTLLPTIVECFLGVAEYRTWRKGFKSIPDDEENRGHAPGMPIEMMPIAEDTHRHQH